jgi:hypothetical protein
MVGVSIEIRRCVDDDQPGWVECWLTDAHGREWVFVEKAPVVSDEYLDSSSHYPRRGVIACEVIERRVAPDGDEVVVIDTGRPWGVEAMSGETRFEVRPEQLEEFRES